jgi:hypothetical protein
MKKPRSFRVEESEVDMVNHYLSSIREDRRELGRWLIGDLPHRGAHAVMHLRVPRFVAVIGESRILKQSVGFAKMAENTSMYGAGGLVAYPEWIDLPSDQAEKITLMAEAFEAYVAWTNAER